MVNSNKQKLKQKINGSPASVYKGLEAIECLHANLSVKDTKHEMLKVFDSPFDINIDLYK